jgi:T1SS-143 domain-containing protein
VVGEVRATASDGTTRILQVGDKVFSDEVISTSPSGDVKIALEGAAGKTLECGNDTTLALTEGLLGLGTAVTAQPTPPGKPPVAGTDVAALQAQIAAGADPSQVADATAAGGAPGAGGADGGGSHQPVVIDQGNQSGVVTSGFPTEGGSIQFPAPEFEEFPVDEEPSVSVTVQVQVQVQVEVDIGVEGQPDVVKGPAEGGVFAVSAAGDAVSLVEGTMEGTLEIPFVITLSQVFDSDVQVTYQIVPASADYSTDFFDGQLINTVTIPAGEDSFIVPIQIVRDHFVEGNETFSIVLIDAVNATIDPAHSSASVTIFNDDAPPVANPDTNWVQEDAFVGEGEAPQASGNVLLTQSHPDDPSAELTFADAVDTDFEPLTVSTTGVFEGDYGTLVLNSNGSYTYTLNNSHPDVQVLADGQVLTDTFDYSVTDGFNGPDSSTLTITIFGTNDGPSVGSDTKRVSEEGLEAGIPDGDGNSDTTDNATASGQIAVSDPDGDTLTVTLLAPSGTLTSGGETIVWTGSGTQTLFGSADGNTIVTITIDNSGNYTVELSGPIDHSNTSSEDERSFTVPVSATDGEGVSNGSLTVIVEDDGPTVLVSAVAAADALVVDESDLEANASASANFADNFSNSPAFGADGGGNVTSAYTLSINSGSTGLVDTATGQNVVLSLSGGAVEGRTATSNELVFKVTVDASGEVKLEQLRAVMHTPDAGPDQATTLSAEDLIVLTRTDTITDNDGDSNTGSASINIGKALSFEDDAPTVTSASDTIAVDEDALAGANTDAGRTGEVTGTGLATATGTISDNIDFGEDGFGAISGVTDGSNNGTLNAETGVWTLETAGYKLEITASGSYTFTLKTSLLASGSGENLAALLANGFTINATDRDGDPVSGGIKLNVNVLDDIPVVSISLNGTPTLTLDESIGADSGDANAHLDDNVSGDPFSYGTPIGLASSVLVTSSASAGADGADSAGKVVSLNVVGFSGTGIDSGLDALNGSNILLYEEANGDVTGRTSAGGDVIFAIRIANDGTVTVAQYEGIKHPTADHDESLTINGSVLQAVVTMTDNDGDVTTASVSIGGTISFEDDGPTIAPQNISLANAEDNVAVASLNLDGGSDSGGTSSVTITGETNGLGQAIGADGAVLTSGGTPLTYITVGDVLYATTNGLVSGAVFSVDPDLATGTYTVTMLGTLDAKVDTFTSNFGSTDAGAPGDPYTSAFIGPNGQTQSVDIFGFGTQQAKPSTDGLGVDDNLINEADRAGTYFGVTVDKVSLSLGNFSTTGENDQLLVSFWNVDTDSFSGFATEVEKVAFYDSIVIVGNKMFATVDGVPDTQVGVKVGADQTINPNDNSENDVDLFVLDPAGDFNFLYTEGTASSFKITSISFETTAGTDPVVANFTVNATDADGDTASSELSVTFAGTNSSGGFTVLGTDGDDVLNGSVGNDILTGDLGDDTFQWGAGEGNATTPPVDTVTDFTQSAEDKVDLSDLLLGESAGTLGAYLHFTSTNAGADTTIEVKSMGAAGVVDQKIVLEGVSLGSLGTDDSTIIANLLAQGKLITD